jgi:hypothetical protein
VEDDLVWPEGTFNTSVPSASTRKQKQQVGNLRPKKTTTFYGRQPGEKSHWSGEAVGPWKPVAPTKVVEVRYDHLGDGRFAEGLPTGSSGRTRRDPEHKRLHRSWSRDCRHKPRMINISEDI